MAFPPQCRCVCARVCELIIAAQLVFRGWSSGILLRGSLGRDHRAGIVLRSGEPAEMGECLTTFSYPPLSHVPLSCLFGASSPPGCFLISFASASPTPPVRPPLPPPVPCSRLSSSSVSTSGAGPVRWVWIHSQRLTFPPPRTPWCPPVASIPVLVSCSIFSKFPVNLDAPPMLRPPLHVCRCVRKGRCGRGVSHL